MEDKEYLSIALQEVNTYIDFLLDAQKDCSKSEIIVNHKAYKDYVEDVRKRCNMPPLRESAYLKAKYALRRLQ